MEYKKFFILIYRVDKYLNKHEILFDKNINLEEFIFKDNIKNSVGKSNFNYIIKNADVQNNNNKNETFTESNNESLILPWNKLNNKNTIDKTFINNNNSESLIKRYNITNKKISWIFKKIIPNIINIKENILLKNKELNIRLLLKKNLLKNIKNNKNIYLKRECLFKFKFKIKELKQKLELNLKNKIKKNILNLSLDNKNTKNNSFYSVDNDNNNIIKKVIKLNLMKINNKKKNHLKIISNFKYKLDDILVKKDLNKYNSLNINQLQNLLLKIKYENNIKLNKIKKYEWLFKDKACDNIFQDINIIDHFDPQLFEKINDKLIFKDKNNIIDSISNISYKIKGVKNLNFNDYIKKYNGSLKNLAYTKTTILNNSLYLN